MRSSVVCPTRSAFKYVNAEGPSMEVKDITDRAAQTMFLTEIFRGTCTYVWCGVEYCVHCIVK
jgi:hypothetical protein